MGVQFGGLVSGLDTLGIIDKLMAVERRPAVLLTQRKGAYQVRYDAWSELETKLNDLLTAVNELKASATFRSRTAMSTNEAVVTGTAAESAVSGKYAVTVNQLAQAHRVASDRQTSASTALNSLIAGFNGGTVTINGQSFIINADDTLETIRDRINTSTQTLGVNATIVDNRLVVTRNETGATQISFTDDTANKPLEKLGILTSAGAIKNELVAARDASLTVDLVAVTRSSNTLTDVISGVTLTLKGTGSSTIEVKNDVDRTVNAVKAFVDAYNAVVNLIADKTGQNAKPLEKGTRSDAYNEDLQQHPFRGDPAVTTLSSRLRRLVTDKVAGLTTQYEALWQVGVSLPSGVEAAKQGAITLDETKLRDALAKDPAAVQKLFSAGTAEGDAANGVATRLYADLYEYTKANGLIDSAQQVLQVTIDRYEDRIKAFNERLELRRRDLVRRFTAMEQSLAALQAQSQWLVGQFGAAAKG